MSWKVFLVIVIFAPFSTMDIVELYVLEYWFILFVMVLFFPLFVITEPVVVALFCMNVLFWTFVIPGISMVS